MREKDEITVNMLVHALRDVFRKEKMKGYPQRIRGTLSCGWPNIKTRNFIWMMKNTGWRCRL